MSADLQPGMIVQLGNGGPGMDSFGVVSTTPYTGAEFIVTAGEGQCGTGQHSKPKRKVDELSDDMASDDDDVGLQGVRRGRRSDDAVWRGGQAMARRHGSRLRTEERYADAQRQIGSKGPNLKHQTYDKRRMVFVIRSTKGNGKFDNGKVCNGNGGNSKSKGGKGKGKDGKGKGGKSKDGKGKGGKGKGGKGKGGWEMGKGV